LPGTGKTELYVKGGEKVGQKRREGEKNHDVGRQKKKKKG